MSDVVLGMLVASIAPIIVAATGLIVAIKGLNVAKESNTKADVAAVRVTETDKKVEGYHQQVNSRMDELLAAEKGVSRAEGVDVGRVEERDRRREQRQYDRSEAGDPNEPHEPTEPKEGN